MIDWIEHHEQLLAWLGGGLATVASGVWVVARYFLEHRGKRPSAPTAAAAETGIAAAGNVSIAGNVIIQRGGIPKPVLVLAAAGLLLLGYAALGGPRIDVRNGSYVGGNVTNSQIHIEPLK
ncbi:MAG TPA: hypothetical protein VMI56_22710 [Reyranella sp.]|nr:hypothetical protein [Reyranella sp.]